MKYFLTAFLLCACHGFSNHHHNEPPCNHETLEEAIERDRVERGK